MIIDIHAHLVAPPKLYAFRSNLQASGGAHGSESANITDDELAECAASNVAIMDAVGTDVQLLSARPYQLMHSEQPASIVHTWVAENNDLIARTVAMHPDRFRGVAALPQCPSESPERWLDELDASTAERGFVGILLNPDPYEGTGPSPTLDSEYWYPVYERAQQLGLPLQIHSAACKNGRETYSEHFITEESITVLSLAKSRVFLDFPDLKVIVSHGGGSVPYQAGRWIAARRHPRLGGAAAIDEPFLDSMRRLYYDTVLHWPVSIDLLLRTVGVDRCVFGTEKPGSGSAQNPETGRDYDDLKPVIEEIDWLSDADREAIFEQNARKIFTGLPEAR